ncbi:hypothetical protein KW851_20620, partial [Pseudomonas sp. PDM33]|nr:hypothetical protein [Pseudomonas sp. PDM33]
MGRLAAAIALAAGGIAAPEAFAGAIVNCNPANGAGSYSSADGASGGTWQNGGVDLTGCTGASGSDAIILNEASASAPQAGKAWMAIGKTSTTGVGTITLTGPSGITLNGVTSLANNKITNLANGTAATDAATYGQLQAATTYFHTNSSLGDSSATGTNATAIGPLAVASSASTVAIGNGATANSGLSITTASLALGSGAVATAYSGAGVGDGSIAIGTNAQAVLTSAGGSPGNGGNIAIGINANATGTGAWGNNTVIGLNASTTGYDSVSLGSAAKTGFQATALGRLSSATGQNATAVGWSATATGTNSSALGNSANASAANSVALGASSTTTANLTTAGYNPGSGTLSGTASTNNGEISVGSSGKERRVTNVAAGSSATDAVNVSQLQSEDAKVNNNGTSTASALGGGAAYSSTTGSISAPSYALANANSINGTSGAATDVGSALAKVDTALGKVNTQAVNTNRYFKAGGANDGTDDASAVGGATAAGAKATASGGGSTAVGQSATSAGTNSVALGSSSAAAGFTAVALGTSSNAAGSGSVAIGQNASAANTVDIAIGANATVAANAANALAIGSGSQAGGQSTSLGNGADTHLTTYSVAIGHGTTVTGATGVALGAGAVTSAANSVALGTNSTTTANLAAAGYNPGSGALSGTASAANGEVSLGSSGKERRVTNVAAGSSATDAVNVSQLQSEDAKVNNNGTSTASALGGGAAYSSTTGSITAPSYALANANSIGGTSGAATDVGSAFAKVDTALGKVNTQATNTNRYFKAVGANDGTDDASAAGGSVASGIKANASGSGSVAMGQSATSSGNYSIAAGINSTTSGLSAVALGNAANASGASALALGQGASAGGTVDIAIGANATIAATAANALAIGAGSQAGGQSTSLGNGADTHLTTYSVAIGHGTTVTGASGVALGAGAVTSAANSVALGTNSTTTANLAAAGYNPGSGTLSGTASAANGEVSLGSAGKERRVTNVAAGSSATDAVNVSQLQSEDAKVNNDGTSTASALGGGATYSSTTGSISAPSYALTNANSIAGTSGAATNVGSAFGTVDSALGKLNTTISTINNGGGIKYFHTNSALADSSAGGTNDIAIGGAAASSGGSNNIAMGTSAQALNGLSIAIGNTAAAKMSGDVALGSGALAQSSISGGYYATAIGTSATATSQRATALGGSSKATGNYTTAVGAGATASADNSVALGENALADRTNTVSVGNASASRTRQVVNMAAGTQSTDAVNVSQLTPLVTALGGAAAFNSTTGAVTGPSYALTNANSIGGSSGAATDVGTGFGKVDAALGVLNTTANKGWNLSTDGGATSQNIAPGGTANFAAGTNATVTRSGNTVTVGVVNNPTFSGMLTANGGLTVGAGQTVSMGGNKVTNVADGNVASGSKDAVDGGQLYNTVSTTATALGTTLGANGAITAPSYALTHANSINGTSGAATDVGSAFGKVDDALGSLSAQLNDGGIGLVQQSAAGENLTVGKDTDGAAVDFLGTAGARKLINVADGAVAADSKEAVNGSQLFATNQNVAQNATDISNLDGRVTQNTTDIAGNTTSINNLDARVTTNEGDISTINNSITNLSGLMGDAVMYDSAAHDKVTLGNADTPVQLTNIKAGDLSADSKDAVNGSQLFATNQDVAQNTADIAGNTTAITNLDGRVTNVEGDVSNINTQISNGTIGLVQQSAAGENLTVGKDTDGAAVDFLGTAGARKLINVADGAVAADSKEAVNGSQLFATNQNVAQNTTDISNLDGRVTQNTTDIAGNTTSITNLDGRVTTNEGNISNLDARVTTNEGDISTINNSITNLSGLMGDAVMYDSAAHDKVTLGNADTPVQLTNIKAGDLSADSKDAVNGSQLFATNQDVAQNTADIAGNTTAITNLDGRVTNVEGDVSNINTQISNGTIGLVQQSAAGENLTVGKDTDGAAVDFLGTAGARKLINVADGAVAADSKEAVNGSQLFATNQNVAQNTADIAGNTADISNLDGRVTQNTTDIAGNTTSISNLDARVTTNEGDISTINNSITNLNGLMGDAVMYDSAAHDKVTLGNADTPVQLTNIKAGDLSADSKDAVNGSQLFATNQDVAQNTADIAGNTTAITNLDGRVTNVEGDVSNINTQISNGTIGLVQQSAAGENLTVGKDTDGAAVDFLGTAGARKLINVADGAVAADSKEAVNGSQLFATNQNVAQNTTDISNLDGRVTQNTTDIAGNTTSISNLDARVTTNEGDISTINNSITNLSGLMGDAVMYDSAAHDKVTLGNADTPVQLTNIKAGDLSADSKDAVNGSQLFATNQDVAQNTADITNLDGRVTNVEGDVSNINTQINNGTIGLVQQSAAGENLTVGKDTDGAAVDFLGTAGARKLINVADGAVAADSKEAVNGSQLFATNQNVA